MRVPSKQIELMIDETTVCGQMLLFLQPSLRCLRTRLTFRPIFADEPAMPCTFAYLRVSTASQSSACWAREQASPPWHACSRPAGRPS